MATIELSPKVASLKPSASIAPPGDTIQLHSAVPGIRCALPSGAFYLYPSVAGLIGRTTAEGKLLASDLDVTSYLLDVAHVAVVDGASYGLSPYLRLSFATSMEAIEQGCLRIRHACERLF